jgi:hypothetical protein
MSQKIEFEYEDINYTLEYTARSVADLERQGFDISAVEKRPMLLLPQLFAGAFRAHHKKTPQKKIEEIFDCIDDKQTLIQTLVSMYSEPIAKMVGVDDEADDDSEKKVKWTVSN